MDLEFLRNIGLIIFVIMGISLVLGITLAGVALYKVRNLEIPKNAGFAETLKHTPFIVVIVVDLLDLAFDFLAAPISWMFLDRLGLQALRGVSAVEALIPGTQLIPTMTLCWIGVRLFRLPRNEILQYDLVR
jgi:hypothetical protein